MHKSSWRRERRDSRGGYVSWPGITVYSDSNRIPHLNNLTLDPNNLSPPYRPTPMIISCGATLPANLPSSQQCQESMQPSMQPLLPSPQLIVGNGCNTYPQSSPASNEAAVPRQSPATNVFSSYHRLLPQFSGQLLWSSIISILTHSSNASSANQKSNSNGCVPNGTPVTGEWVPMESNGVDDHTNHAYHNTSSHTPSAATIVNLPPFQPESMLHFQTQFMQLPTVNSSGTIASAVRASE